MIFNQRNYLSSRQINLILWSLVISASILRILTPFFYNPIQALWSDPGRWWEYASTGLDTPPLALIDPTFYQAWLSFIAKFTLDIPELTALYSGLLSALTPWFWYLFLREVLESKQKALLGWAILAWLPSWIGIYSYFMSETLLLLLLGISFWLSMRCLRKQNSEAFLWALIFWILCSITRGICAPMGLSIMLILWWQQPHRLKNAIITLCIATLILGSLSYRSYQRSGMLAPLGQAHLNEIYAKSGKKTISITYYSDSDYGFVYGFGSPSMGLKPFFPVSLWQSSRQGEIQVKIDINDLAQSWQAEKQRILQSAPNPLPLVGENLIWLFFGTSWPDENPNHFFEDLNNKSRFIWLPLFIIAIFYLIRAVKENEKTLAPIFLAAILSWFIFQGLFLISVNEGRYRKPVEGLIICVILIYAGSKHEKGNHYRRRYYRHALSSTPGKG